MKKKTYSLRKARHFFFHVYKNYKRKKKNLPSSIADQLFDAFANLREALDQKDKIKASEAALKLDILNKQHLQKTSFEKALGFLANIAFALIIAVIVRQMWFEFYEIPTGSMRPTLKEKDRLVVSKNQFSLNIPLTAKHFYFDPSLVKRSGIVVFTGKNMDIHDVDTMYFYLFPGKKQYIKRLIGKPGDTLYFYGGRIYGVDENLNDISGELQLEELTNINHVPFIGFEGKAIYPKTPKNSIYTPVTIYQMNLPVAKLSVTGYQKVDGQILKIPSARPESDIRTYEGLWGFENYAMARLLTHKEFLLTAENGDLSLFPSSDYYLELTHHPSLEGASVQRDLYGKLRPTLGLSRSYIPMSSHHLKTLFDHLYTARFIVDAEGYAYRYGYKNHNYPKDFLPKLQGVPAGMYEFYYGKAYAVYSQGITKELPESHPIYHFTKEKAYLLFNLGIEFDVRFLAEKGYNFLLPSRYAFYRNGELFVMGAPLLSNKDSSLLEFIKNEKHKELVASPQNPYTPFIDHLPPLQKNGALDVSMILKHGITVPKDHYLVLGDNYAMSADSRDFGFVPEDNLRGIPDFIFWPPGSRFGKPNQPAYTLLTPPRVAVWALAAIIGCSALVIQTRREKKIFDEFKKKASS